MPRRLRRHRPPQAEEIERFWKMVDRRGPNECWPWKHATTSGGYGWFIRAGGEEGIGAHVFAFMVMHGVVPPLGIKVCHTCDNPPCCNSLAHHFLGTDSDNMRDMTAKGRRRGAMPPRRPGASNGRARLTDADVADIRRLWAHRHVRPITQRELALRYRVGASRISAVVRGETYQP